MTKSRLTIVVCIMLLASTAWATKKTDQQKYRAGTFEDFETAVLKLSRQGPSEEVIKKAVEPMVSQITDVHIKFVKTGAVKLVFNTITPKMCKIGTNYIPGAEIGWKYHIQSKDIVAGTALITEKFTKICPTWASRGETNPNPNHAVEIKSKMYNKKYSRKQPLKTRHPKSFIRGLTVEHL